LIPLSQRLSCESDIAIIVNIGNLIVIAVEGVKGEGSILEGVWLVGFGFNTKI
jgi:hypothetical protein